MVNAAVDPRTQTVLFYPQDTEYPQSEMALGIGTRSRKVDNTTRPITADNGLVTSVDAMDDKPAYGYDAENNEKGGKKLNRIAPLLTDSDSDTDLSVGKQLELEATNSIKYRTCSWPKVI